jgi:uncharacterized membrane protein YfcA
MDCPWHILAALAGVGFLAGFVDAIAGGGGLLTQPALLLAGLPVDLVLGTNKGQSVFGSGMALVRYAHSPLLDRARAVRAFVPGLLGAALGVWLVTLLPARVLAPLVIVLLMAVAVFMIFYRPPQVHDAGRAGALREARKWAVLPIAFVIAAYDGFFGPGTGTFLILAYALYFHDSLDAASANAKVVNFASNLASMVIFAIKGWIVWKVALPMGAGQALGAWTGAHITIKAGRGMVRCVVLLISLALVAVLAWKLLTGRL